MVGMLSTVHDLQKVLRVLSVSRPWGTRLVEAEGHGHKPGLDGGEGESQRVEAQHLVL